LTGETVALSYSQYIVETSSRPRSSVENVGRPFAGKESKNALDAREALRLTGVASACRRRLLNKKPFPMKETNPKDNPGPNRVLPIRHREPPTRIDTQIPKNQPDEISRPLQTP
jgi:hypothetical protein